MSVLLVVSGLAFGLLFAAAGFRTVNGMRYRRARNAITYQGRVQALYDNLRGSVALSAASFVKHAIVAKSAQCRVTTAN